MATLVPPTAIPSHAFARLLCVRIQTTLCHGEMAETQPMQACFYFEMVHALPEEAASINF